MTLESAIKHCEEVAEDKECIAHSLTKDGWQERFDNLTREKETEYKNVRDEMANSCLECAKEHRQLAEWLKDYKRLLEQEPCEDAISRREAIKKFTYNHKGERILDYDCDNFPTQIDIKMVKEMLRKLPSVNPQPKTGRWIRKTVAGCFVYGCDNCGWQQSYTTNFCPDCKAKMVEPQESEGV